LVWKWRMLFILRHQPIFRQRKRIPLCSLRSLFAVWK
jgi:hypothetical protein